MIMIFTFANSYIAIILNKYNQNEREGKTKDGSCPPLGDAPHQGRQIASILVNYSRESYQSHRYGRP